jgi:hypothetical protein
MLVSFYKLIEANCSECDQYMNANRLLIAMNICSYISSQLRSASGMFSPLGHSNFHFSKFISSLEKTKNGRQYGPSRVCISFIQIDLYCARNRQKDNLDTCLENIIEVSSKGFEYKN